MSGRPSIDDSEHVEIIRSQKLDQQRLGYRELARRYVRDNPHLASESKPESVARRLADKARLADGVSRSAQADRERVKKAIRLLRDAISLLSDIDRR